MLIIIKVDIAQAPGMRKLLPTPVKHAWAAQVPAYGGWGTSLFVPGNRPARGP